MTDKVEMKGLVESAEWLFDAEIPFMNYTIRVMRPDLKDENLVGHVITLVKPEREQ